MVEQSEGNILDDNPVVGALEDWGNVRRALVKRNHYAVEDRRDHEKSLWKAPRPLVWDELRPSPRLRRTQEQEIVGDELG